METPNIENSSVPKSIAKDRATSPTPTSSFSLENNEKQPIYKEKTAQESSLSSDFLSESPMATPTNLEIGQQEAETHPPSPEASNAAQTSTVHAVEHMQNADAPPALSSTNDKQPETANEKAVPKKKWSGLFTQKERGPATFKVSASSYGPKSKNANALIININALHDVKSDTILLAINQTYGDILLGAKFRFTKNGRTHLELIFNTYEDLDTHLFQGINLLTHCFKGYFPSAADRTYLHIIFRNMPIFNKEALSSDLAEIFADICPIASIKPMLYTATSLLSDQWMVSLNITDKETIVSKFPRIVNIRNHKVSLHWRNAPVLCHFCDKEGHYRKNCPDLAEAKKERNILNELKKFQKEVLHPPPPSHILDPQSSVK